VLEIPTIKIVPPTEHKPLIEALAGLGAYDWIIFTSANGVTSFFQHFFRGFEDLRDFGGARIAAVGPATAAKLAELHLKVDLIPKEYEARLIAKELAAFQTVENLRVLLLRAEVATPELPRQLEDMGAIVDDVACYRTVPETDDPYGDAARLGTEGAEWVMFTSASTVEHFHARFDLRELCGRFPTLRLASIGPETTKALTVLGLSAAVQPKHHTVEALIAGVVRLGQRDRRS